MIASLYKVVAAGAALTGTALAAPTENILISKGYGVPTCLPDANDWGFMYRASFPWQTRSLIGLITGCNARSDHCIPFFYDVNLPDNLPDATWGNVTYISFNPNGENPSIIEPCVQRVALFQSSNCASTETPTIVNEGADTNITSPGKTFRSFMIQTTSWADPFPLIPIPSIDMSIW